MTKTYRIMSGPEAGIIVYRFLGYDYGCSSEDTRRLGVEHVTITKDPAGGTPFFTIPRHALEEIK